jgi:branched-subunit amino acid ABC-type transport system permease component
VLQSFIKAGTRPIYLLIVTAAMSLVLQNGLAFVAGGTPRNIQLPATITDPIHIGPFVWTQLDLIVIATATLAVSLLYAVLQFTRFGRRQRAVADLPELARVSGINVIRVVNQTWLISGLLAGLAGIALAMTVGGGIQPAIGFNFLLVVFAAAILGGIGKPYGALLGAIVIGVATEVWAVYFNAAYKTSLAVAVLILVLLFRPSGLIGSVREIV